MIKRLLGTLAIFITILTSTTSFADWTLIHSVKAGQTSVSEVVALPKSTNISVNGMQDVKFDVEFDYVGAKSYGCKQVETCAASITTTTAIPVIVKIGNSEHDVDVHIIVTQE